MSSNKDGPLAKPYLKKQLLPAIGIVNDASGLWRQVEVLIPMDLK
jgi:hypothetical protein